MTDYPMPTDAELEALACAQGAGDAALWRDDTAPLTPPPAPAKAPRGTIANPLPANGSATQPQPKAQDGLHPGPSLQHTTPTPPAPQRPASTDGEPAIGAALVAAPAYTRIARATATLHLLTPGGAPVDICLSAGTPPEEIAALLATVAATGKLAKAQGWTPAPVPAAAAEHDATTPSAAEMASGPTFAGFPCSPTVDSAGLPTWIIVEGKQAQRREKQGDVWYSAKTGEDAYTQVLRIPKGEQAPAVVWPAGMK